MTSCPSRRQIVDPLPAKRCLFVASAPKKEDPPVELLESRLCPVLHSFNYAVFALTDMADIATFLARRIQDLLDADLVIFDPWKAPGDMFFMIGIRYASGRPLAVFHCKDTPIPETVKHLRPIPYDTADVTLTEAGIAELTRRLILLDSRPENSICRPIFELLVNRPLVIGGIEITPRQIVEVEDFIKRGGRIYADGGNKNYSRKRYM